MTVDDINKEFDDFQDDLIAREKHLKLLVVFNDDSNIDYLLDLLDYQPKTLHKIE